MAAKLTNCSVVICWRRAVQVISSSVTTDNAVSVLRMWWRRP